MIVHCVRARLRSLSGKKTISSSFFWGVAGWKRRGKDVDRLVCATPPLPLQERRAAAAKKQHSMRQRCNVYVYATETALRGLLPAALLKNQVKAQ